METTSVGDSPTAHGSREQDAAMMPAAIVIMTGSEFLISTVLLLSVNQVPRLPQTQSAAAMM